jgi:hypothetical protein
MIKDHMSSLRVGGGMLKKGRRRRCIAREKEYFISFSSLSSSYSFFE